MFLYIFIFWATAWAEDDIVQKSISIIDRDYLWVEDLAVAEAFSWAAEAAEESIPWLIVEPSEKGVELRHGEKGVFSFLPYEDIEYKDLAGQIHRLAAEIRKAPATLADDIDLEVTLLQGIGYSLDRYSVVMHKESLKRFNERIKGRLSGIGCRIQRHSLGLKVKEVFPDGPAADGGVLTDDIITHIDGASIKGVTVQQGVERIRGKSGSQVQLTISRGDESIGMTLTRRTVRIPNVRWRMEDGGVGVIQIESFSEQTSRFLQKALREFKQSGDLKSIIVDLRGNSGGSMIQSCKTVDAFVKEGLALRTVGRDGKPVRRLMRSYELKDEDEPEVPVVVLINRRSASASEIVAGSLKIAERALLIGEQTHGKGVVQMPHRIRTGSANEQVTLKLTVAKYLLEGDFSVHDNDGVSPHIWLSPIRFGEHQAYESTASKGLVYALEKEGWRGRPAGELRDDFALEFALQLLRTEGITPNVENLKSAAMKLSETIQQEEWLNIQEIFSVKNLNWQSGPSNVTEKDIDVDISVMDEAKAGSTVKVQAKVTNNGKTPIYRTKLYIDAGDHSSVWSGTMIPIGYVAPGESKTWHSEVKIPLTSISKVEKIFPSLTTSHLEQYSLPTQLFEIKGGVYPSLSADVYIESSGNERIVHVALNNESKNELKDLKVRLGLPNSGAVEFRSDGRVDIDSIRGKDTANVDFRFVVNGEIGEEDGLTLIVNAGGYRRVIEYEGSIANLAEKVHISHPKVAAGLPLRSTEGTLPVEISFADDGAIKQATFWLDGEKIGWQENKSVWKLPVALDSGEHEIVINVQDDQDLVTSQEFYMFVE